MKASLFILAAGLITSSFSFAQEQRKEEFAQPCKVKSEKYPELQSGVNKTTICSEVKRELNRSGKITSSDEVVLTEAGRSRNEVNFKAQVIPQKGTVGKKHVELAVLSWWEGGDVYVNLVEQLPPQYMYKEIAVRTDTADQDRP